MGQPGTRVLQSGRFRGPSRFNPVGFSGSISVQSRWVFRIRLGSITLGFRGPSRFNPIGIAPSSPGFPTLGRKNPGFQPQRGCVHPSFQTTLSSDDTTPSEFPRFSSVLVPGFGNPGLDDAIPAGLTLTSRGSPESYRQDAGRTTQSRWIDYWRDLPTPSTCRPYVPQLFTLPEPQV